MNTTLSVFTATNRLVYTQVIPAGTLTLSNGQITNMISAICNEFGLCGINDGTLRKLVLKIQNGTTVAQKDFRVIMDCTTACL